jgi:hypothetical protein
MVGRARSSITVSALCIVLQVAITLMPIGASAQVAPGQGYAESPKERAAYQSFIDRNGANCPGLHDRLYGRRYRCIARFSPGAKASQNYSETLCSNIDIRMKACGVPVPNTQTGLTPAELGEQEQARQREGHKP